MATGIKPSLDARAKELACGIIFYPSAERYAASDPTFSDRCSRNSVAVEAFTPGSLPPGWVAVLVLGGRPVAVRKAVLR